MSFRVWWQQFDNASRGQGKLPPKEFQDFPTREEAEMLRDSKRRCGGDNLVVTITPTPPVKTRKSRGVAGP